jgi:hypothetical protein
LTDSTGFIIPPKLYDFLKWIALAVLPFAAALVITLGTLLHWDGAVTTAGVITAVDTFLGLTLGKSASNYKKDEPLAVGDLVFGQDEDGNAVMKTVRINKENPVFNVGSKLYLNVVRDQPVEKPSTDPRYNMP